MCLTLLKDVIIIDVIIIIIVIIININIITPVVICVTCCNLPSGVDRFI